MKKTCLLLIASLFLVYCKAGKETISESMKIADVTSPCPEKALCNFEILKDKSLDIKTDDTGHTYFNLKDAPGKTVFKYTHKKITDPNLMDAGYSETIIFETNSNTKNLNYSGADIQKVKMLLNVQCYCPGKAGIYIIKEGTLNYKDNKLHIEIPQIVHGQKTKIVDVVVR